MRAPSAWGIAIVLLMMISSVLSQESRPEVGIGMVLDGPWEKNEEIFNLNRTEIANLLEDEFSVSFPVTITCDFSRDSIDRALDSLLASKAVDIVIASGPIASHLAVARRNLPKPVIAPYVIDQAFEEVPYDHGVSGVPNLNYLAPPWHVLAEIEYFHKIMPFKKLGFLATGYMVDAFPYMREITADIESQVGVQAQFVEVRDDVAATLAAIEPDVDAVYVTSVLHLKPDQMTELAQGLIDRRLPSFAMLGKLQVERGLMIGLMPDDFFIRAARRVALNIQRILLGEQAGELPVAFPKGEQLVVNMATVRAIDKYPNWEVLTEAEQLNQSRRQTERAVTLRQAIEDAVKVNLDLVADALGVEAGRESVRQAWMALLPQVEASVSGLIIDDDRAEASFGAQPERSLSGSLSATQVIFSEPAWANLSIAKHQQRSREAGFRELKLDIGQAAATAFLNVLRAKTLERIQRDNLKVTRQNLNLARVRRSLGTARAAEVLRWESQIASNQRDVINANSSRNIAEIQEKMGLPVDQPMQVASNAAGGASISGIVRLDESLALNASIDDTVFVYARAASGPRMPLAIVRKTVKDLPFEFTLNDSMAMNPAMKLSSFQQVVVGARVSKSGNAMPQPGDLQVVSQPMGINNVQGVELVINEVIK